MNMDRNVLNAQLIRVGGAVYRQTNLESDGTVHHFDLSRFDQIVSLANANPQNQIQNHEIPRNFDLQSQSISGIEIPFFEGENGPKNIHDIFPESKEFVTKIENDGSKFRILVHIPKNFHGCIIKKKGIGIKRFQDETKVKLKLIGETGEIFNASKNDCLFALFKLLGWIRDIRSRFPPTHFLSVRLPTEFVDAFKQFKCSVLSEPDCDKNLQYFFQKPQLLHVTIVVMHLGDNFELKIAKNRLVDFFKENLERTDITFQVKGLDIMNDDPSCVNVLYARVSDVSDEKPFQNLANKLHERFAGSGLGCRDHQSFGSETKVKLHVTLMNTKNQPGSLKFDARTILNRFGDFDFGTFRLENFELSERNSYEPCGYYRCHKKITLK